MEHSGNLCHAILQTLVMAVYSEVYSNSKLLVRATIVFFNNRTYFCTFTLKLKRACSTILLTVAANCDSSSSEILRCSGDSPTFSDTMGDVVSYRSSAPVLWFETDTATLV